MKWDISWNENALNNLMVEVMQNLAHKGRQRPRTVTCPVHETTHAVVWETQGDKINVVVRDPCCDDLEKVLYAEAEKAIN